MCAEKCPLPPLDTRLALSEGLSYLHLGVLHMSVCVLYHCVEAGAFFQFYIHFHFFIFLQEELRRVIPGLVSPIGGDNLLTDICVFVFVCVD